MVYVFSCMAKCLIAKCLRVIPKNFGILIKMI